MRDIRFRYVFCKPGGEYRFVYSSLAVIEVSKDFLGKFKEDWKEEWTYLTRNECTGFRDKHKVEVYEGDIVEFKCKYCGEKTIRAIVEYEPTLMSFVLDMGDNGHYRMDASIYDLEIIDTIYQNRDMAKQIKGTGVRSKL